MRTDYKSQTKKLKTPAPSQENLDLQVVEKCSVCWGSIIMYISGSYTLIRVNGIGLDIRTDRVLV